MNKLKYLDMSINDTAECYNISSRSLQVKALHDHQCVCTVAAITQMITLTKYV